MKQQLTPGGPSRPSALESAPRALFCRCGSQSHSGVSEREEKKKEKKRWQLLSTTKSNLFFILLLKHQKNIRPREVLLQQLPFPPLWLHLKGGSVWCGDISRRSLSSTTKRLMCCGSCFALSTRVAQQRSLGRQGRTDNTMLTTKSVHLLAFFCPAGIRSVLRGNRATTAQAESDTVSGTEMMIPEI